MYAVILAGGGGTRLHPLSRPERPKPFLPLLGERSLLQATVERLAGLTDDITVVTDRRYERLVREQVPTAALVRRAARAQHGRRHRAGDPGHRPPRRRGHGRPAGRPDGRARPTSSASPARGRRAPRDRRLRHRGPARDPRHPGRPAGDRVRLPHPRRRPRRARSAACSAYPLVRFEEKPKPARAEELAKDEGVAWNAGIFLWRRRAIGQALTRYTGLLQSLGPMVGTPGQPASTPTRRSSARLDRLRGDGGRRPERPGRDGLDGRRLVRPRVVDGAAGGARGARERGASSRPARPSRSTTTT